MDGPIISKDLCNELCSQIQNLNNFSISEVDYIALSPSYTSRLFYNDDINNDYKDFVQEKITDLELIDCVTDLDGARKFQNKYGYACSSYTPNVYYVENPEFKFWQWGLNLSGEDNERSCGAPKSEAPIIQQEIDNDNEIDLDDYQEESEPIMIWDSDVWLFNREHSECVLRNFGKKYRGDLYGSIIFRSTNSEKFELNDWLRLAETIDIDFCACYSPTYPYRQKLLVSGNKSMLIVEFDCESG